MVVEEAVADNLDPNNRAAVVEFCVCDAVAAVEVVVCDDDGGLCSDHKLLAIQNFPPRLKN